MRYVTGPSRRFFFPPVSLCETEEEHFFIGAVVTRDSVDGEMFVRLRGARAGTLDRRCVKKKKTTMKKREILLRVGISLGLESSRTGALCWRAPTFRAR